MTSPLVITAERTTELQEMRECRGRPLWPTLVIAFAIVATMLWPVYLVCFSRMMLVLIA